jgi:hypothetical protein
MTPGSETAIFCLMFLVTLLFSAFGVVYVILKAKEFDSTSRVIININRGGCSKIRNDLDTTVSLCDSDDSVCLDDLKKRYPQFFPSFNHAHSSQEEVDISRPISQASWAYSGGSESHLSQERQERKEGESFLQNIQFRRKSSDSKVLMCI